MSYTWLIEGIHETVRYWNVLYMTYSRFTWNCQVLKCPIHDLQQVYTKHSGIEMSYSSHPPAPPPPLPQPTSNPTNQAPTTTRVPSPPDIHVCPSDKDEYSLKGSCSSPIGSEGTVVSRASAHLRASAHPSILTVLWFFKVLCVNALHTKFLGLSLL